MPAGVLVVLGAVSLFHAFGLGLGSLAQPGPGLWPLGVSAYLILLAVLLRGTGIERVTRPEMRALALSVVLLMTFIVTFTLWGIVIPTLAVLGLWLRLLARQSWLRSLLIAGPVAGLLHVVFVVGLSVF